MSSATFHRLRVAHIQRETPDTVSIRLEVPEALKADFAYQAGQYLTLRAELKGEDLRRAYSMSSSPLEADLVVTVKKVPGGKMSSYLHDSLREGQYLDVLPPEGRFVANAHAEQRRSVYLFGSGSGITPLMSILKTVLEEEPQSSVFLLYGSRDEAHIIFREALDQLAKRYQGQFFLTHTLSQPRKDKGEGIAGWFGAKRISWQGWQGRIGEAAVRRFLAEHPAPYPETAYYLCGPGDMIAQAEAALLGLGAKPGQIHKEYFSGTGQPGPAPQGSPVDSVASIRLRGQQVELTVPKGQSILDAMLAAKIEAPYSCMSGACSTCMAKVTEGQAKMDVCLALDDEEVAEGYVLTCQAKVHSPSISVNFDA